MTPHHPHQPSTHLGTQKPGEKMSTEIQETINRLRELDRTASPAPWEAWGCGEDGQTFIEHPMGDVLERGERRTGHKTKEDTTWVREADADLITETRNAIPALLAEIERLAEENQALKRENHLAWSKGHAAGWDCHIVTMQAADLLPKDQKTSSPLPGEEMTAHKTTTHDGVRWGKTYSSTWCDQCHWTHTTPNKQEAAQAATNHEKDNQ